MDKIKMPIWVKIFFTCTIASLICCFVGLMTVGMHPLQEYLKIANVTLISLALINFVAVMWRKM